MPIFWEPFVNLPAVRGPCGVRGCVCGKYPLPLDSVRTPLSTFLAGRQRARLAPLGTAARIRSLRPGKPGAWLRFGSACSSNPFNSPAGTSRTFMEHVFLPCTSGNSSVYCVGGEVNAVPLGYYSTPTSAAANLRTGIAQCNMGFYCVSGVMTACAAGTFGSLMGISVSTCSGTGVARASVWLGTCWHSPRPHTDCLRLFVVAPRLLRMAAMVLLG